MGSISSSLLRRSYLFETLELRQLLTAVPDFVADMNPTPVRFPSGATLWESDENQVVWVHEGVGRPSNSGVQVHLTDKPVGQTLIEEIEGRLSRHTHAETGRLTFSAVSESGTAFWATDGTPAGTQQLGEVSDLVDFAYPLGLQRNHDDLFTLFQVGETAVEQLADVGDLSFAQFNGAPVEVGDHWYVRLQQSGVGNEVWVTDGTLEGTQKIPAIAPGPLVSFQDALFFQGATENGDRVVFRLNDPNAAPEVADGLNGTAFPPNSGIYGSTPDLLFGSTINSEGEHDYWVAGQDLEPRESFGSFSSAPTNVVSSGFYFDFNVSRSSRFRSDGTVEGTLQISSSTSPIEQYALDGSRFILTRDGNAKELQVVHDDGITVLASDLGFNAKFVDDEDGKLFFASNDEMWSTDGTVEGTRFEFKMNTRDYAIDQGAIAGDMFTYSDRFDVWQTNFMETTPAAKVVNAVTEEDNAELVGRSGDTQFFTSGQNARNARTSLWAVDGSSAVELLNLTPGKRIAHLSDVSVSDEPLRDTTVDGWFYFLVEDSGSAEQTLWRTQGTAEKTEMVGTLPAGRVQFTSVDSTLTLFVYQQRPGGGWSSDDGTQLWVVDANDGNLRMVAEQVPYYSRVRGDTNLPESFAGKLYFPTYTEDCHACLWSSDLTTDGTGPVEATESVMGIFGLRQVEDELYFVAEAEVYRLQDDESLIATGLELENGNACCTETTSVGDRYVAITHTSDSDGTSARTIVSTDDSGDTRTLDVDGTAHQFFVVGDKLHYRVQNNDFQIEFYSTNGTEDGTELYFRETAEYELVPLESGAISREYLRGDTVWSLTDDGTSVYLRTEDEIWKSDGTAEGTHLIADVSGFAIPVTGGSAFAASSSHLFFNATTKNVSDSLFRIATANELLVGDIDQDWDVDFADFLRLSNNFGKEVDAVLEDGDLNQDGRVNFEDFLLLSANFGEDFRRPTP